MINLTNLALAAPIAHVGATDLVDQNYSGRSASNDLLPQPALSMAGGDMLAQISALLTKVRQADRTNAKTREASELAAQVKEDAANVAAQHAKADETRSGGIASGVANFACAGLSFAGAGAAIAGASANSAAEEATKAATEAAKVAKGVTDPIARAGAEAASELARKTALEATAGAQRWVSVGAALKGGEQGATGCGGILAARHKGESEDRDADAVAHGQASAVHARIAKSASENANVAREDSARVLEWFKEMRQAQHATEQTVAGMLRGT